MHIDRAYYVHVRNHVSWYVPSFEKIMTLRTVTRASGKAFVVLQINTVVWVILARCKFLRILRFELPS